MIRSAGFHCTVAAHNSGPLFVVPQPATGKLTPAAWQQKQTYDREIIHPPVLSRRFAGKQYYRGVHAGK